MKIRLFLYIVSIFSIFNLSCEAGINRSNRTVKFENFTDSALYPNVDFTFSNFSKSEIRNCRFSSQNRSLNWARTNFEKTKIRNSSFEFAKFNIGSPYSKYIDTENCYTGRPSFNHSNLINVKFNNSEFISRIGANLGSDWCEAYAVSFYDTFFKKVSFSGSRFEARVLSDADDMADIGGFLLCNIEQTNFRNITIKSLVRSSNAPPAGMAFKNCSIKKVSFRDVNMELGILSSTPTVCDNEELVYGMMFKDCDISNTEFYKINLKSHNLKNTKLLLFENCTLRNVSFNFMNYRNITFKNTIFSSGVNLRSCDISKDDIYNLSNYSAHEMSELDLSGNDLNEIDLSEQNLKKSKFQNSNLSSANLENADLSGGDLRGADLTNANTSFKAHNTIMTDGVIKNFSMTSEEDSFSIAKHENAVTQYSLYAAQNASSYNGISAKISEDDALVSGGAVLTIDDGGLLEVVNGKTLTVDNGGILEFNIGEEYEGAMLSLENGTSFVFGDGEIVINFSTSADDTGVYTFEVIDTENGSFVGYDSLVKDENVKLFIDGEQYTGDWYFIATSSGLSVNVPEPATYAVILGAIAIAFCVYRRRK